LRAKTRLLLAVILQYNIFYAVLLALLTQRFPF